MIDVPHRYYLFGTGLLVRLDLKRDRILIATWVALLTATCYASAAATAALYPTVSDQVSAARAINSSGAIVALYGPVLDPHSLGELAMTKMTVLYAVLVAVMCLVVIRRHTRTEEESGRTELVGGTAVGQGAQLAAAVVVASLVSVVLGFLAAAANLAGGLPIGGSLWFGASWAGIGLVAVGVSAVACQLSASSRTCGEFAAAAIAAMYALRAAGDTSSASWLSWLSPFGWSTQLRAWSSPRPWVLLLYLVLTAVLVASAFGLQRSRDIGSGLLQARPGPSVGSPRLRGVGAITFRMNAVTLTIWSVATGAMSVALGAIAPNISNVLHSSGARGMIERIGGVGTLRETLLAAELSITAVIVTCFGLSVVGHTASDERDGRTAQVLASPTSRTSNFAATTAVALLGTGWLMLVAGSCLSLGYWSADGGSLNLIAAALVHLPAVWLVIALGILAWSFDNSFVVVGWGFLALFLTLGQLGELLQLPAWIIGISPYTHVPLIPVESFNAASTVTLSALAAVALALASTQYARRDIL